VPVSPVLFYGIRGLAYPLFIYSFMMMLVQVLPRDKLAAAHRHVAQAEVGQHAAARHPDNRQP
jgi:hypothetical protein